MPVQLDYISLRENIYRPEYTGIPDHDRQVLRRLASRVAELAARPGEEEKRTLWYKHNALEATRPLVLASPENGWGEIITQDQLECTHGLARGWEYSLRQQICWGEVIQDDMPIEPVFNVMYIFTESDWGLHETLVKNEAGGSYIWDTPLKDYADLDKIRYPTITVDYEATEALLAVAKSIFGDLLHVKLSGGWYWSLAGSWAFAKLRGLEEAMMDIFMFPEEVHKLMALIRDISLAKLDFLESENLLSLNNGGNYIGSGGIGLSRELPANDFDGIHVRTKDLWGFCESQETVGWSPDQFEEFIFQYQLPIMERFGLNYYGCCEPLHDRWHVVKKAPRLRRVSCSPWIDHDQMAQNLQDKYVYCMKPNPAPLAASVLDQDSVRKQLRHALEVTRNCRVEIIMKDTHTFGNNPENVINWTRIAKEEAEAL